MSEKSVGMVVMAVQFCAGAALCALAMALGWPWVVGICLGYMALNGLTLWERDVTRKEGVKTSI